MQSNELIHYAFLQATTDNAGIRSLCHKILSIVFDEEM